MEGTSEASLAASAPREAQMLYQPMNRGQDLTGRDSGVRSSPERQSSDLSLVKHKHNTPDRARQRRQVESGTAEQRSELLLRQIRRLM